MSSLFRLNVQDLAKGLVIAVIAVVLGALQQAVTSHGFDIASYNWSSIVDIAWKAGGLYLSKNLLSDQNGRVFGKIG